MTLPLTNLRNRVAGLEYHRPSALLDHPAQWRTHPAAQVAALTGVLQEVGIAGALLAYRSDRAGGALVKMDGHLRAGTADVEWPVLVLDVTDAEADYILATHDPLAGMAGASADLLDGLLASVQTAHSAVQAMLDANARAAGVWPDTGDWGAALGGLPSGDKAPFQQMTFTLSDDQAATVKAALRRAQQSGPFVDTANANSNGNALARICEAFDG